MNKYIIILSFFCICSNVFSQSKHCYQNDFIASTIRNEYVSYKNDKDRIFILVANLSCSKCLKDCSAKLTEVKSQLRDSSEYIIIMQGNSSDVMSNRAKISGLTETFQDIDSFLFDFNLKEETILDINKYELRDFPVLIIAPKLSDDIWIIKYPEFSNKSTSEILPYISNGGLSVAN